MISFSDCDFASNEPEGVNPTLPSASALFGSLGLMVATMNLGEDEASACAPQSGANEPSSAKTMQRTTTSWSILNGRFNCGFATKPDIPSGAPYYRTESFWRATEQHSGRNTVYGDLWSDRKGTLLKVNRRPMDAWLWPQWRNLV